MRTTLLALFFIGVVGCADTTVDDTDTNSDADTDADTDSDTDADTDTDMDFDFDYAEATDVVINEIVGSNDFGLQDEFDEFDDWLEIYNKTDSDIDLTGWGLTDNESRGVLYRFPDGAVLPANGFQLVWCDDTPDQGDFHAEFKISRSGDTVMLINPSDLIADEVTTPELETDTSYGRRQDGGETWDVFAVPTPEQSNEG